MTDATHQCPKCDHPMELGLVFTHFVEGMTERLRLVSHLSHWTPGSASKATWAAMEVPNDKLLPVGTYRCSSCGYLESYARPEFAAR